MSSANSGNLYGLQASEGEVDAQKVEITRERLTRIKFRMAELGIGQADLAAATGLSASAISQTLGLKINRTKHFSAIATALHVNLAWLLGETEQRIDMRDLDGKPVSEALLPELLKSEAFTQTRASKVTPTNDERAKIEISGDMAVLREIDLAQCDGATSLGIPVKDRPRYFSRDMLQAFTSADPRNVMFAQVSGDTMQPTLNDGDLLLVDTSRQKLDGADKMWVGIHFGAGFVKRLRPTPKGVRILSDNLVIPDELADEGELRVLGLVVGIIRRV